jgi:DMSO/TMAO reductase YedYZ molybdopterin-dependent catalytic subunit
METKGNRSIPIEVALRERTLLAYEFDGEYLEED